MPTSAFKLSIVTPEGSNYEGDVTSVVFPGEDGYIGVWAHHAAMLSSMRPGTVTLKPAGAGDNQELFAVSMGFFEVSDNNAILLVDSCEPAGEIDVDRAERALARSKEWLREAAAKDSEAEAEQAQLAKERAEARLRAAYLRQTWR